MRHENVKGIFFVSRILSPFFVENVLLLKKLEYILIGY